MAIRGAIFDMDGTLTASMHIWATIGSEFLKARGITPAEDFDRRFTSMSVYEAVGFMMKEYNIEGSRDEITDAIDKTVEGKYREEVVLKEGVAEFLEYLESKNIPMCVATATDEYIANETLERLGVRRYFKKIITSRMVGLGKDHPDIFFECARILGTEPGETAVFEDSVVAIRTATKAGFFAAAVPDKSFEYAWDEIKEKASVYAEKLSDYIGKI
ncbi:MAG: HAD family phosphatase [Oscillospiraceae bacterium]|nr:HAD family phosphatase [Oscillospiraceae bacterium]